MCKVFHAESPGTFIPETRAVRLNGYATSIRLEAAFWRSLEEIAEQQGMSTSRLVSVLHDEILADRGKVTNFASLLRVICLRWSERRVAEKARPRD